MQLKMRFLRASGWVFGVSIRILSFKIKLPFYYIIAEKKYQVKTAFLWKDGFAHAEKAVFNSKNADITGVVRKLLHIFHIVFHIFAHPDVENSRRIIVRSLQKLTLNLKEVVA